MHPISAKLFEFTFDTLTLTGVYISQVPLEQSRTLRVTTFRSNLFLPRFFFRPLQPWFTGRAILRRKKDVKCLKVFRWKLCWQLLSQWICKGTGNKLALTHQINLHHSQVQRAINVDFGEQKSPPKRKIQFGKCNHVDRGIKCLKITQVIFNCFLLCLSSGNLSTSGLNLKDTFFCHSTRGRHFCMNYYCGVCLGSVVFVQKPPKCFTFHSQSSTRSFCSFILYSFRWVKHQRSSLLFISDLQMFSSPFHNWFICPHKLFFTIGRHVYWSKISLMKCGPDNWNGKIEF